MTTLSEVVVHNAKSINRYERKLRMARAGGVRWASTKGFAYRTRSAKIERAAGSSPADRGDNRPGEKQFVPGVGVPGSAMLGDEPEGRFVGASIVRQGC